jgi:formate dehydrogenase maturation protein FdhE
VQTVLEKLTEAAQKEPNLASYYEFHHALLELQQGAKKEIAATLEMADEEALQARLKQGLRLISFEQLPIEQSSFVKLVADIAEILTEHEIELEEEALPDSPAETISLARERFEEEQDDQEPEITLAQAAVDLALKPYVEWAAEQVMPHVDDAHWKRNRCPVCGGAPDLATLEGEAGARHLMCSRCSSQWSFRRVGCPFCNTTDHTKITYYSSDDEVYRLYVCQECQRYLKTIDLRKARGEVLLPAERITTIAMDAAARQEGYR